MTSNEQRAALQRQIWAIANDVRGAVDGWDFKQYVLGTLFYRFISENFASYIEAGDDSINYAALPDSVITPEIKEDAIKTKGYACSLPGFLRIRGAGCLAGCQQSCSGICSREWLHLHQSAFGPRASL